MSERLSTALADLCPPTRSITYGIVQPGKPADGGVPIVRVNNFRSHRLDLTERLCVAPDVEAQYSRSRPHPNDILISLVGSIGQVAIAGPEISGWNLARAVGLIPTKDRHHALWIFYALQCPEAQRYIRQHANTTVQATFNLKDLTRFPIPYPEFQEREQIIGVLGSLDDKIELNRRMNETLEAMAQAIFRDWFVDFGPTRRKLDGAIDPLTIMGGLVLDAERAQAFADLFPAALGDDGLPEGWAERALGAFVEIIGGGTPKTSNESYWKGSIPWFSVTDTPPKGSIFVDVTEKTISKEGLANSSARLVRARTTIISARGTVGNLALTPHEMTFNQSCYGLQGKGAVGDCFVFLAAQNIVERLKGMAHGSVFSTITRSTFDNVHLACMPDKISEAFENLARPMFDKVLGNVKESRTLEATRDLLLPKLMSGEIRLSEAEELMEAAQ